MKNDTTTIEGKIKEVNSVLLKGEPGNISADNYSGMTGYKPQYIIDAMNAVFGIGEWGFTEVSNVLYRMQPTDLDVLAIAQTEVWIKGIDFKPKAYGQARITRGDVGDAQKGAQTDAIKKALSYFSIGNRAFHGLLGNGKTTKPEPEIAPTPSTNVEQVDLGVCEKCGAKNIKYKTGRVGCSLYCWRGGTK